LTKKRRGKAKRVRGQERKTPRRDEIIFWLQIALPVRSGNMKENASLRIATTIKYDAVTTCARQQKKKKRDEMCVCVCEREREMK
jgi:hypothetical protein